MSKQIPYLFDSVIISSPLEKVSQDMPNTGRARVRVFSKYGNRNGSYITDQVADQLIESAITKHCPVVGFFDPQSQTWASHTGPTLAHGYGYVEDFLGWEPTEDTDGVIRDYAVFSIVLHTDYFEEANKIIGQNQSMELNPKTIQGEWAVIDEDEYFIYSFAEMLGFCVIGSNEPCFSASTFFSKNEENKTQFEQFSSLLFELRAKVEEAKNFKEGGEQPMEENKVVETPVEETVVEETPAVENFENIEEPVVEETIVEEPTVEEPATEFEEETPAKEEPEVEVEEPTVEETSNTEFEALQNDFNELQSSFEALQNELTSAQERIATFEAEIEIVKKDAETGKVIPASGIGFKVRNKDTGEFVIQRINYPTPTDIEIYYTDAQGKLMLPYALPYGNYEIIEQNTCFGYVLDSTPVAFKVDGSTDLVTVVKSNYAQKGTITISKFGEVFSSVAEKDGIYQPVYEIKGLEGAVYEVIAVEDVITLDGTTRYTKGQVVATITTGKDGKATTEPLYLGKYEIREVKAPYGMVLNTEPVNVELVYAGEHVEITETSASFTNERQKMVIDLKKTMENDEIFGIGTNGEITNVQFGMYAAEDMTAADGKVIPKDALIETAYCDKDGNIVFATDLPVGAKVYIKETNTDCHYVINDESFKVDFNYAGQKTEIIRESVNKGEAIENEILRGTIVGKKVDEDGFTICGALFGLFRADETEFTEKTAVLTCESNEIGIFYFENVPYGNWIVREIKAAPAFVLNETSYEVTIDKDGAFVEIGFENKFITGSVQTIKVDKEYPENTLVGAVFEIYVDVDNNKEFDKEIDLLVGEMSENENGLFTYEKLRYNGYFLHEKSAPVGFLKVEIMIDCATNRALGIV